VFRRADKSADEPGSAAATPLSKEEAEAGQELCKNLANMARLLEAEKYGEFTEHCVQPQERDEANRDLAKVPAAKKEELKKRFAAMAKMLRIISARQPLFDATFTHATFDLRALHINGGPMLSTMNWVKVDGKWYIDISRRKKAAATTGAGEEKGTEKQRGNH
jgi:hypothetical protein